ncbi:MAG: glycerol-3-phosphate dehydrogenase [Pseudomonadota bacterium]|nr:glycerol-3-phosphate dehydrogenase [Pseudomonadota bacterium]
MQINQIGILGAGSWGSALAIAMSHIAPVLLWSRNSSQIESINVDRVNPPYLDNDILFPANITATTEFNQALNSELIIIATPSSALRDIFSRILSVYSADNVVDNTTAKTANVAAFVWVCKGFEPGTGLLPHQIIQEIIPPSWSNIGALLGPSFAREVALGMPTAISLVSKNLQFAAAWANKLKNIPNFRVYAHDDVIGSEIGAGVKNIMAIAVGISDGLGLGYNARAALITRSLHELGRLVECLGGKSTTIYGLTGVGDLILTCTGDLSRNRNVGLELAKGHKIEMILNKLGHVAEGVSAAREVYNISRQLKLEMPIVDTVYKIIYENADITQSVAALLSREPKLEFDEIYSSSLKAGLCHIL